MYRGYQKNLRANLAQRVLQPADVDLEDQATESVVQRLLGGDDVDLALALELVAAQHDGVARLRQVVSSLSLEPSVRVAALDRLVATDRVEARVVAESLLLDRSPLVHTRADHVLADLRGSRSAVDVRTLMSSADPDEQAEAYRRMAEFAVSDASLLDLVIDGLGSSATATMAGEALSGHLLGFSGLLDGALSDPDGDAKHSIRLVRCTARSVDPAVVDILSRHVLHRSRDVGLESLQSLVRLSARAGSVVDGDRWTELVSAVIHDDAAHGARCHRAQHALEGLPGGEELRRSLEDELTLLRRRTLAALGLLVGRPTVVQARAWLEGADDRAAALALEALEVSMPAALRSAALGLLQSSGATHWDGTEDVAAEVVLDDLERDLDDAWRRPWLRECAVALRA